MQQKYLVLVESRGITILLSKKKLPSKMHKADPEFSEVKISPRVGILTILIQAILPSPKKFRLSTIISFLVQAFGLNV